VSEVDSWLAEDDEIEYEQGYNEEDDVVMLDAEGNKLDDDDDVVIVEDEAEKKKKEKERRKKQQQAKERAERKKKNAPFSMPPVIKGLAWEDEEGENPEKVFRGMKAVFLNGPSAFLSSFPSRC
jgi:chromatin assembly factor 1 subunit A